jgi:manganese/zinc/iron transport system permease protein
MMATFAVNPYRDADFFSFFGVMMTRLWQALQGKLAFADLVSDEIQMLVLIGLCFSSALVGTFLVLKKMTMMANALCHTILLGIVIAFLLLKPFFLEQGISSSFLSLKVLIVASFLSGLLTTILTQLLTQFAKIQEDASIGLVFTSLFALGVVLVTIYTRNVHIGTEAIMGNIDALDRDDLSLVGAVALMNLVIFFLFFRGFTTATFDPLFARSIGLPSSFLNYFIMVLTAATCIAAFRAVGVLLVLTFFVAPPLMARLLTDKLKTMVLLSFVLPAIGSILSVALSRHILVVHHAPVSTSGLVVCVFAVMYLLLLLFAPKKGIVARFLKKKVVLPIGVSH